MSDPLAAARSDGHKEPCYFCGKPCDSLTGRCSRWPVGLCHPDDPGVTKWHHEICIMQRLQALIDATEEIGRLKAALRPFVDEANAKSLEIDDPTLNQDWHYEITATVAELKAARAALGDKP